MVVLLNTSFVLPLPVKGFISLGLTVLAAETCHPNRKSKISIRLITELIKVDMNLCVRPIY